MPVPPERLQRAADALQEATLAWRQAAGRWLGLATEARGQASPVPTEMGDLVLRMGRLAWDDPHWTPTRMHPATVPAFPALTADARDIVAVVHQAADALAQVAAADASAMTSRDRAGRLYVPTRTLPDGYDVPRRHATAPAQRTWPLLEAYTSATQASARAAAVLADLAFAVDAPSSPLALARAASAARWPTAPGHSQPAAATTADEPPTQTAVSGPVEQAIRQLRVDDPAMLLRAAAIDQATRLLLTQAGQASQPPSPRTTSTVPQQRPGDAARLAASDCPAGLAIKPANGKPGNRTAPAPANQRSQPTATTTPI